MLNKIMEGFIIVENHIVRIKDVHEPAFGVTKLVCYDNLNKLHQNASRIFLVCEKIV